jgi:hypothetical protein
LAIIILICFFLSAGGGGMIHAAAHPSGSFSPELLGISDPFGSSLLPANPAGGSSSGSFRPVAVHGNKDGALAGGL